jgi:Glucose-6-phosphate isomerase
LEINPFDQPNVQLAKTITKGLLSDLASGKKSEETSAELLLSDNLKGKVSLSSLASDLIALPKGKDYIALLAYMHNSKENDAVLSCLRDEIFTRTKRAVLFGYGPRYLHSTGQLHKGDGNNGIFIIISADAEQDVKIPAQAYSFADLVNAQALADFKALREKGRRVIKIHLKKPVLNSLKKISSLF